jgi:hypothetical protein
MPPQQEPGSGKCRMETTMRSGYTALLTLMTLHVPRWCRWIALLLGIGATAMGAQQQPAPNAQAAEQFVREMLAKAGTPATVSIQFENRSSLSPTEFKVIRRAIEAEIRRLKLKVVSPEMAIAECRVTISENVNALLWIAQVKQGLAQSYAMLSVPRKTTSIARPPSFSLHDLLLWSQREPILDMAHDNASLNVLTPAAVVYMARDLGSWRESRQQQLRYSRVMPRDMRGKLTIQNGTVDVLLPGIRCSGAIADAELRCAEVDDPWPLDASGSMRAFFSSNRNFFTGALSGRRESLPPFFSAARTFNSGEAIWLLAGTDGVTRAYSDFSRPAMTFQDWGSDIAAVTTTCGREQVLVSKPGDRTEPDAVQSLELLDGEATPMATALRLPGPVMGLNSTAEGVNAILYNRSTQSYEAHVLSVTCD